ncbi:multiubiquitin domain-containing protein [Janthinobacterium sp. ZB1P44]|uniref:multiubiquitin domain-containing protein n=1 Tax=Janthinobacterium sp. ZB1P44 TaxID=3424192 RepID=UPI003F213CDA
MNNSNFIQIKVKRDVAHAAQLVVEANGQEIVLRDTTPTGRQILNAAQCHPTVEFSLLQLLPDRSLEEISPEEVAQMNQAETSFFALQTDSLFYFLLNDNKYPWAAVVNESVLRMLAGVPEYAQIWMERRSEVDKQIEPGQNVSLKGDGIERFYTKLPTWQLDVQGVIVTSAQPRITVRQALELAKIDPDRPWNFILKIDGKKESVELTTVIDLTKPGIERLRVMPKVINNGEGPGPRRQFSLLENDARFLNSAAYHWETIIDADRRWLLLHDYQLPAGYHQTTTTLAIDIPALYPTAELDMFYCAPALSLNTDAAIPQTEFQQTILGAIYQRWSRHRESQAWSPACDSVITHLGLVEEALQREVVQ